MSRGIGVLIGLTLPLLTLSACGSDGNPVTGAPKKASAAAWKAELAGIGVTQPDWDHYVETVQADSCDGEYDNYVTLAGVDLAATRIGIKYACPEHLDAWDEAVVNLCNTSLEDLPADDQLEPEAVC
jgi:hypothetical protein